MKRRRLHQNLHPFDAFPFEVFSCGSWKPVKYLQISAGIISMQVVDEGDGYEENVLIQNLRIRSRKATVADCICYLRPGLDVCVLFTPQSSQNSCENDELKPVWLDSKIKTIERRLHETGCDCQFYVEKNENVITVKIEKISILQKLNHHPCENKYFRWQSSQDCASLQQSQLFPGKFASDLSWAVVTSLHRGVSFDIRSIRRKILYQISQCDHSENFVNSSDKAVALNFKVENRISVPVVFTFSPSEFLGKENNIDGDDNGNGKLSIYDLLGVRKSKRRNIQPDRYIDTDICRSYFSKGQGGKYKKNQLDSEETPDVYGYNVKRQSENGPSPRHSIPKHSVEKFKEIHHSTTSKEDPILGNRTEQPQRVVFTFHETDQAILEDSIKFSEDSVLENCTESKSRTKSKEPSERRTKSRENSVKHNTTSLLPRLASEIQNQDNLEETISWPIRKNDREPHHVDEFPDVCMTNARSKLGLPYKKSQTKRYSSLYSPDGTFPGISSSSNRSLSTNIFKEMMAKCVENIKRTIGKEQPLVIDQWNEIQAANSLYRFELNDSSDTDGDEKSELDLLWNELDLALASTYLLGDSKGSNADVPQSIRQGSGRVCDHEYKLNEEIGILCQLCGHVETEIKDIFPKFLEHSKWMYSKGEFYEQDFERKEDEGSGINPVFVNTASGMPSGEGKNDIWTLIPDLRGKLRFHQKKAFEFLWHNIAGSLIPAHIQSKVQATGGCVISHSPGAGKTLLIIAFLESYLKLFPKSRPLVLAPKTTLYAWYKEITKWNISVPVYRIHSRLTSKGESLRMYQKLPTPQTDYIHMLDCMEKIQKWVSHPSVLLMGYPSFLTLSRGHANCSYKQYMAAILMKSPGILILDEGHNPRATKSGLRKALMRVETKLRILLSGTLFQNNFGEYFNTLVLARPSFINEVTSELNPNFKRKKNMSVPKRLLLENRARKLFIDRIAKNINAKSSDERAQGLNMLRKLTTSFIDVYEGGNSDNLPGLQCYTLMMKSTPFQQELLVKLKNEQPRRSGFALELGALITLGSIHPCLIQTTAYASQHFTLKEMESLEKSKFDLKLGPKVRFVMSLLPRCIIKNEKVLVFCYNIAPINLFVELFESVFGWKRGDDVLVLTGDSEFFERGRIMDNFEEKGSNSKVLLASIAACSEGISLIAASRLIFLDFQWNPSKTKQAIARAYRPGQQKVVYVYQLLTCGTIEEDKYVTTTWKEWVSNMIFHDEIAEDHSQMKSEKVEDDVLREIVDEDGASLFNKIIKNNEKASNAVRGE